MLGNIKDKIINNGDNKKITSSGLDDFDVSPVGLGMQVEEQPTQSTQKGVPEFKKNKKAYILVGFVILLVVIFQVNRIVESNKKKEMKIEADKYKVKMLQDPHTSMCYYMELGSDSRALESAAKLIGHTMDTGCTTSYDQLRKIFTDESLKQLYPYLTGSPCKQYYTANVVCLSEGVMSYEYMVRITKSGNKYKINIGRDEFKPIKFDIEKFELEE